jgi:NAD(P)-dependent dehydrogenase (short-subunit alcohol dehydrogenase family)
MIVTIISGASRGIGKAIAEDLKSLDHKFILLSSKDIDFKNYLEVYKRTTSRLGCFSDIEQINLILCAAQIGTAKILSVEECNKLYKINVLGNLAVIKAASKYKIRMRIVWFAGGGAAFPYPEFFAYSLSKIAVIRAVENFSLTLENCSIIALAPGAVDTDMLKTVLDAGCEVRTRTDISEPVNFVRKFITDEFDSVLLNGMFLHVRDDLSELKHKMVKLNCGWENPRNIYKLRRIE